MSGLIDSLTKPQQHALRTCKAHVTLVIGSVDETPGIRRDVVMRLAKMGLVQFRASHSLYVESEWELTDRGREYLGLTTTPEAK